MQDTTKDQDSKTRRMTPILVDGSRIGAPHAEALRDVHSSLVRAGQSLYNLVQSQGGQANGATPPASGFAYPQAPAFAPQAAQGFGAYANAASAPSPAYPGFATPGYSTPGYATPGFATPGFATPGYATPAYAPFPQAAPGAAFGAIPAMSPWAPQAPASPWKALAADIASALGALQPIASALGALQHAASIAPGAFAPNAFAPPTAFGIAPTARAPAIDLFDEGKQFTCLVDLPGLKASQVEVLCVEQALVVSAYREADGDSLGLVQAERGLATAQRTIPLPAEVQPASAKATLANGVLTVVLPKANPTEGPRRVKVQG